MVKTAGAPAAIIASFSPRSATRTARIGPSGGAWSPNRRRSALLNGRSQANAFPAASQVRLPCRSDCVTSGRARAIAAASSMSGTRVPYRRAEGARACRLPRPSGGGTGVGGRPRSVRFSVFLGRSGLAPHGEHLGTAVRELDGRAVVGVAVLEVDLAGALAGGLQVGGLAVQCLVEGAQQRGALALALACGPDGEDREVVVRAAGGVGAFQRGVEHAEPAGPRAGDGGERRGVVPRGVRCVGVLRGLAGRLPER